MMLMWTQIFADGRRHLTLAIKESWKSAVISVQIAFR